ncbi:MAG TPA: DUF47 family protein [Longimicrobiaceae bacterium]|nr:DUF47 family protein [Longimicrobiaceae bacterium]
MRLIPRDERFFPMFGELAQILTGCAQRLAALMAEPHRLAELAGEIKELEHRADQVTHEVIVRIDRSFVTPLDREDIHLLASRLDDVIDLLDGCARRVQMFHITETRPHAVQLADVIARAAAEIEHSVVNLKKPKAILARAGVLKKLEEEGDFVYAEAMGALFQGSPEPLDVIRWKEMYDKLEDAVDLCDDVSNVLESIALKNG